MDMSARWYPPTESSGIQVPECPYGRRRDGSGSHEKPAPTVRGQGRMASRIMRRKQEDQQARVASVIGPGRFIS